MEARWERKIKVRDWNVHYVISGHGPKYMTCLSGGMGFGMVFKTVLEGFDPDKFTVIAWDTPGYAKSRPPHRVLNENLYEDDAVYAYEFMMALNITSYSILGLCAGGVVAMFMAAKYPEQVENLILINSFSFVYPHEWKWTVPPDVINWTEKSKDILIRYSGEDYESVFRSVCTAMTSLKEKRNGVIVSDEILQALQCKTLILAGAKDEGVDQSHVNHLNSKIKNSRIYVYPEGKHYVHIKFADDVNERMQLFLLE